LQKDDNSVVIQFPNQIFLYRPDSGDERNTVSDNEREKMKFYLTVTTPKECYLTIAFSDLTFLPACLFFFKMGKVRPRAVFTPGTQPDNSSPGRGRPKKKSEKARRMRAPRLRYPEDAMRKAMRKVKKDKYGTGTVPTYSPLRK